ncbi:MAG: hypothetical protein ABJA61_03310 [Caldimonas sp.]
MRRDRSRGLTMVELLVGTAIGLLIGAASLSIVATNMRENRQLLLEARLMQDLRLAADMVGRDLRRAGYWAASASGIGGGEDTLPIANPYAAVTPAGAASDVVHLGFSRDASEDDAVDDNEQFGFRLRGGAIEMQLGAGNWQALSDAGTLIVTSFDVAPRTDEVSLAAFCVEPCAAGSTTCPPRQQVRSFVVALSARSTADASVSRSLRSSVRLRNDRVVGSCEG